MRDTELRWLLYPDAPSMLRPNSARDGSRGTGGTEDDRALPGSPLLTRRSRVYGELIKGCSPRGSVAESWRVMPDLYFEARDSLDKTNDVATSARAMLVPDTADEMSSVIAEEGLGGRLLLVGSGGGTFLLASALSSAEDCTLIFTLVELFGILMGDGVGFRMECAALCGRISTPSGRT